MENTLRVIRAERRVSQRKLAKQTAIEVTRLWKIENDYLDPTCQERRILAEALGVSERRLWPGRRAGQAAAQGQPGAVA